MADIIVCVDVDVTGDWDFELEEVCTFRVDKDEPKDVLPFIVSVLDTARQRVRDEQSKEFSDIYWGPNVVASVFEELVPYSFEVSHPETHPWKYEVVVASPPQREEDDSIRYAEIVTINTKLFKYNGLYSEMLMTGMYPLCYGSNPEYDINVWAKMIEEHVDYSLNVAQSEEDSEDRWIGLVEEYAG